MSPDVPSKSWLYAASDIPTEVEGNLSDKSSDITFALAHHPAEPSVSAPMACERIFDLTEKVLWVVFSEISAVFAYVA